MSNKVSIIKTEVSQVSLVSLLIEMLGKQRHSKVTLHQKQVSPSVTTKNNTKLKKK